MSAEKEFASHRALLVHGTRAHGRRQWARRYVASTTCPACRGEFRTIGDARLHLSRSARCTALAEAGGVPVLAPDVVAAADVLVAEERARHKAAGPRLPA